jgi:CHASE3 domain sensor protein
MNEELIKKIEVQEEKIDKIYQSVEKTRKYFQWTLIITVAVVVLPLIALFFILPSVISTYTNALSGLNF